MRGFAVMAISVLAVALAACSKKAGPTPAEPAGAPPIAAAPAAPPPQTDTQSAITPATAPDASAAAPTANAPAMATPAAAPPPYHFSPGDFGKQEHRIAALIANAESRDGSGETQRVAFDGQRARERCATKACVEAAYAAEEAKLRKWEGSADIK